MIFHSALVDQTDQIKGEYLKYWMGTEGLPLIEKWENMGKLIYKGDAATSKNIDTYWTLLEDEFKLKANKITTKDEHDRNLFQFLQVTKDKGLHLNKDKIQFKKTEVSFFGHRWSKDRNSPDPKKIQSIINMDFPEDKETMHSFLGMVNFLNRYSPRLAELCSPLRSLILKETHYIVMDEHRAAFAQLKQEFTTEIMLPYFNKNKYTTLQMDALKKGFGAVILQDNKPIYFTSRSLTLAEKKLPKPGVGVYGCNMGHGKIPLLPLQ